ncbi:hypothetical protein N7471_008585 [Penicillium samsonianum]|uniref:uncharacterized protein n=1 Tax=Penicillium samsonianum TaxID=1882272 RepID=UPI0025465FAD|nr:uncharacterized protein N7471_008585 [Penicillium samsonianum]KAJ6133370.1 hypothetical protein N7471_008585 [Penicillium samsonianum]
MSSNKGSSSDFLAVKNSGTTGNGTTSLGHNDTSQMSSFASNSESQEGSSYMLDRWAEAPPSSEPWSSVKATYFPKR